MGRAGKTEKSSLPLVAIVGRPNVGKSTLFNRLTGQRRAIVTNEPGITRDRIYGVATWQQRTFTVVDTGGLVPDEKATMAQEIFRQARVAIKVAAKIVLVVDVRAGVTPLDAELARLLAKTGRPLLLAANKVDAPRVEAEVLPFHRLGIDPVVPLSAEHGGGVAELLEELVKDLPAGEAAPEASDIALSVAIIGRPNVGKSTLLNRLVGEERAIVTAEAGTTRDAVDTLLPVEGKWWRLIDTAGIRRKGKTKLVAEKLSVVMARKHLERADVAVLLLDAAEGVTKLDAAIAGYAHASGRSLVLAVNKWDAVEKDSYTLDAWAKAARRRLKFLDYAPLVFISALKGQRIAKLQGLIALVDQARRQRVADKELKNFLRTLGVERASVPGGRAVRITGLKQVAAAPPLFVVHASLAKLHFSFQRFLENQLRERFGFAGTPIRFRLIPVAAGRRSRSRNRRRRH